MERLFLWKGNNVSMALGAKVNCWDFGQLAHGQLFPKSRGEPRNKKPPTSCQSINELGQFDGTELLHFLPLTRFLGRCRGERKRGGLSSMTIAAGAAARCCGGLRCNHDALKALGYYGVQ